MPTFDYLAVNGSGERVSGTVFGGSMEQALSSLSQTGLIVERINQSVSINDPLAPPPPMQAAPIQPPPVQVAQPAQAWAPQSPYAQTREIPSSPYASEPRVEVPRAQQAAPPMDQRSYVATSVVGPLTGRVPLANQSRFFRQFGTMLEAGVPIVQALDTLGGQNQHPKMQTVIHEIRGHVDAGRPVSAGMQRYPEVFAPLAMSLVKAGEEGGFVAQSMKLLADYTDKEIALRNLIRRLTLYPKIVLFSSIVLIIGANLFITMMGKSSDLLRSPLTEVATWVILGPLLIGAFLFFRVGLANPAVKYNWDRLLVKLPFGVGKTVHEFAMSKFGIALAYLYQGGVPVHNAISLAADACGNEYIRGQVSPASRRLESGDGITDTLRRTEAFSPIVMDMVDTGERTGNMDQMLLRMSNFYEDEAETRAKQIAQIFSVILLLIVAIYVLYLLITFYTRLFSSYGSAAGE